MRRIVDLGFWRIVRRSLTIIGQMLQGLCGMLRVLLVAVLRAVVTHKAFAASQHGPDKSIISTSVVGILRYALYLQIFAHIYRWSSFLYLAFVATQLYC